MTDIWLPDWLNIARARVKYIDSTGMSRNPYNGQVRTASLGGDKLGASIEFTPQGGASTQTERAALISFLARMRGRQNRIYLSDASARRRGSFPTSELLSNNTFASGTTGWSASAETSLSAADRVLRARRTMVTATQALLRPTSAAATTQYAPHVARFMVSGRRYNVSLAADVLDAAAVQIVQGSSGSLGLFTAAVTPYDATAIPRLIDLNNAGNMAGDYVDVPYASFARCALVDNAANATLQASDLTSGSWTANGLSARNANTAAGYNLLGLADVLVENSSAGDHSITQTAARTSAAADLCAFGIFARVSGTRNVRLTAGNDGTNYGHAIFDLGTGTIASGPSNAGTATNARAFIVNLGNGYFHCSVVARVPAAATMQMYAQFASGTSISYTGNGTSSIAGENVGICVSSVSTRGGVTTATALASGTVQTGAALYVKGLPASTSGLLLIGDQVEVITSRGSELKIVTASLNSDAAGLGYLQFEPPLRGAPSDNAPIIIHQPMGRFIFNGEFPEWLTEAGLISTASLDLEEA